MAPDKKTFPKKINLPAPLPQQWLAILSISLVLTFPALAAPIDKSPKKDPLVLNGKQLYADLRCFYCHSLKGHGGTVGPALDNVGFRRTREWMAHHFRNPKQVSPDTKMVKLKLKDSQVGALVAYMNSLGGYTFTPQAPELYRDRCGSCHSLDSTAEKVNDLSQEGKYRDMDFLMDYIRDPSKLNAETKMKGYKNLFTQSQIKDIAAFLYQQGR